MRFPLCPVALALFAILSQTGCPKTSALPRDLQAFGKSPKAGVAGGSVVAPLPPPQPISTDLAVMPPKADPQAKVPALPGTPAAAAKPGEPLDVPQPPTSPVSLTPPGDGDDAAEGPIARRLRENRERREAEKQKEAEKEKPKEPEKPKTLPPAIVPDTAPPLPPRPPAPPVPMQMPMTGSIPAPSPAPASAAPDMRALVKATAKRYESIPDYECRLTKREVVKGKAQPGEEMTYKFRKEPHSVYMLVTSDNGKGRELLYVKGANNGKMTIVTGKGDNALVGVGAKFNFDPEDPMATSKTRNRVANAGFGRPLGMLEKFFDEDATGKRPAGTVRPLGEVERKEFAKPVLGLEITLIPGDDPNLPKGGRRQYFFDNDPTSPSFGFPVLITTFENEKEVEYYCFDKFRMPANFTDADFSQDRLGGKKR